MSTALPPSDGDRPAEREPEAGATVASGSSTDASPAGEENPAPAKPRRAPRSSATTGAGAGRASAATGASPGRASAATGAGAFGRASAAKAGSASEAADGAPAAAKPAARKPAARKTDAAAAAAGGTGATAAAGGTAAKKPATRTRKSTTKPAAISPEGEAPGIMDAALGAREPLGTPATAAAVPAIVPSEPSTSAAAGTGDAAAPRDEASTREVTAATEPIAESAAPVGSDTSTSPAEPLAESEPAPTKRLPTAEEVYAGSTAPAAVPAAPAAVPATPADDETAPATGPDPAVFSGPETDSTATAAPPGAPGTTAATDRLDATTGPRPADGAQSHPQGHGRTVHDLADRLDDSRFFSSLFDFTFTNYVTRKLAGPVYVVGLVLIGLGIVVGFANSLTSAIATHAPIGAFVFLFGVLITLVGAMLAVLLLRVGIEVFCAIIEIAQNTRRRRPPGE